MSIIQQMRDKRARKNLMRDMKRFYRYLKMGLFDEQLQTTGCTKGPQSEIWIDPTTGLPIGTVIKNHKGEYGVITGNNHILYPLTKQEAEFITGEPIPNELRELKDGQE